MAILSPTGTDGLLGRSEPIARVAALIEGARRGRGATLLIAGAPGVGKTALLGAVEPAGLLVLDAAGAESELDLPLAGLRVLIEPVLGHDAALPRPQREALRGALAPGEATSHEAATVLHATATLLGAVAARTPLLLRIDDVQWLDGSSRQAVEFVARRAHALGIGVLATWSLRGEPPGRWPGVERLDLAELERGDAIALAHRHGVAPAVAETLVDAVGGNPLALTEVSARLLPAQRDGGTPLPDALPLGPYLERAFLPRVEALPEAARAALVVAAASSDGAAGPLASALGGLAHLGPAEDAGLVRLDGRRVDFVHPVARAAVLSAAGPAARRAAHRALAAAVAGPARAWHLAAAADAPDESLASELERHAQDASRRGAPASAAATLERAATLSPEPAETARRTVAAAAAALVAGSPARATALLDRAIPLARDPSLRADAQLLRGTAMQHSGRPMAAFNLLEAEAQRVLPHDRGRAAGLLTQAAVALVAHGPMDRLAELTERALRLAPPDAELIPSVFHAAALASLGEHARAREILRGRDSALREVDPTGPGSEILSVAALCHLWMEDFEDCERLLTWLVETARERGAVAALALPLSVLASLNLRLGAFAEAAALSADGLALGEDAVGAFAHSVSLTTAAFVAANTGDEQACRAHAGAARTIGLRLGLTSTLACAEQALGFLALGLGDATKAVSHLELAYEHGQRFGSRDPSFLYTHADLVEAYVRAGHTAQAATLTDEIGRLAERTGGAWAAAATARCRALTDADDRLDDHAAAALAAHARVSLPFELARTQLCLGERLRRARRRSDSRAYLSAAQTTFAALGAPHWARRAEHELRASGVPTAVDAGAEVLTAREREVAELVAGGATNREIAAALYVSPRTVEHHLRMAYRKLGVRSRSELSGRWRSELSA